MLNSALMVNTSLKILFVTNMYPNAENISSGTFVMHQAEGLKRLGHHVDALHILGYRSRLNYLKAVGDVLLQTCGRHYDIVHAHYGLSGVPAMFRWHTPLVVTLHGSDALVGKIQPFISRVVCSFSDAVIAVSRKIASIIPGDVIPCGVDLEVFRPHDRMEARARLGLPSDRIQVLFPFAPERKIKRHELARAVIHKMRLKGYRIELLAVAGVDNTEMPLYYSAADAMILCSDSEGSPTSVKESLACNTPVVSTDVGDIREIMENIPGTMICEQNVDALSYGLEQVLKQNKGAEFDGRKHIQRYDQRLIVKSIIAVYERVLRNRKTRKGIHF